MGQFFGAFSGIADIIEQFQITARDLDGVRIVVADYSGEDYEGNAFVLFEKDGSYYEVNGGHCSCRGLEEQWRPEKTYLYALRYRLSRGRWYVSAEALKVLHALVGIG